MQNELSVSHAATTRSERRVPPQELRWCCSAADVGAETTEAVEPLQGVVGQDDAVEALRFGLETDAPGQNVYVRGLTGTGRLALVQRLLEDVRHPLPLAPDRCYVYNFDQPDRPSLITLPRGRGRAFRDRIDELIGFVREQLLPALESDAIKERRRALDESLQAEMQALGGPFEEELKQAELAMVMLQVSGGSQPAILPVIDGQPAPPDRIQQLVAEGALDEEAVQALREKIEHFNQRLGELNEKLTAAREQHRQRMRTLIEDEARAQLSFTVREVELAFPQPEVAHFLDGIVENVITRQLQALGEGKDTTRLYEVNLVQAHEPDAPRAILVENQPTLQNLLGTIDRQVLPGGGVYSDHLMIHAGSLLRADGGYLVFEARDVLTEPGSWRVLVRTLRTGKLEITPQESLLFGSTGVLKPEPIPIDVKVILIGDPGLYGLLDAQDPDFPHLFKVLADFDSVLPVEEDGVKYYAGVLSRLARAEGLPHFSAEAVAVLAEHGARIAGHRRRLTTRMSRLADIAREAAFLVTKEERGLVEAADVRQAVERSRRRGNLPARKFREAIAEGTIRIQTRDEVVGQVNGLAVTTAGPLTYGFPARITATIGPGHAGTINIEREAQLSGAIHTKGFYILGGLLRHLLRGAGHALAFSASIAFEQSYGGIDGDSASGAEMCCLLSALTGVGLHQGVAMTGAIDQLGHVQPIGAASEKIEGFYNVCVDAGLTGDQGVIVPRANLCNLMLRQEVVQACQEGQFHVWGVDTIQEALEIFTGVDAGEADEFGEYPEGTLLALAVERAGEFWRQARVGTPQLVEEEVVDEEEELEETEGAEAE